MGAANSHMNVVSLRSVVVIERLTMENILRDIENQSLITKKIPKSRLKRVTKAIPADAEQKQGPLPTPCLTHSLTHSLTH